MYNPEIHHRRSIRLQGYDYSRNGLYFVTICTNERILLFGDIHEGVMLLNDAGKIAKYELEEVPKHRKYVVLHEYIVMPNHVHMIVEIADDGMDCKNDDADFDGGKDCRGVARNAPTENINIMSVISPKPRTLSVIVRAYKSAVSKQLGYSPWQRNYYENIIRNEQSYCKISEYIKNNQQTWKEDKFFKEEYKN